MRKRSPKDDAFSVIVRQAAKRAVAIYLMMKASPRIIDAYVEFIKG